MKFVSFVSIILLLATSFVSAQNKPQDYLNKNWKQVANQMPGEWYGSEAAKQVAENVLLAQKDMGGWEKNKAFHLPFPDSMKAHYLHAKSTKGATFDNDATITEMRFLAKVYAQVNDERYKQAFEKGFSYILEAQYDNGGWPQYYPVKDSADERLLDHTAPYSGHITYNDNAMVNTMQFLKETYSGNHAFVSLQINNKLKAKAKNAFDKGVECILNTQIVVEGKPTVWCAQHDEKTLAPANARAYELASFSGSESVGIVLLLMEIDKPSKAIIAAVNGAVQWFEKHKLEGIKPERAIDKDGNRNMVVVEDKNAPPLWARFYDLKTGKPYFCDRDGIKKNTLAEIGYERRNGYSWYTNAPERLLNKYPEWSNKWISQ